MRIHRDVRQMRAHPKPASVQQGVRRDRPTRWIVSIIPTQPDALLFWRSEWTA